jgi:hypothetical protein
MASAWLSRFIASCLGLNVMKNALEPKRARVLLGPPVHSIALNIGGLISLVFTAFTNSICMQLSIQEGAVKSEI